MVSIRKSTVSGMFYEHTAQGLEDQIKACFTHEIGPGYVPKEKNADQKVLGVVVPHAGLPCSGPFAAHSFTSLMEHGFPDTFVLIGPNHSGMGPVVALDPIGEWETPLGSLLIDKDIATKLSLSEIITADPPILRQQENSLEVQLPFIKFLSNQLHKDCSIVPIVMTQQNLQISRQVGEQLADVINNEKKHIVIIASSDFSHEGYSYGRLPPSGLTADAFARKQDKYALDAIQQKNPELLFAHVQNKRISMCGYGPIISLLTVSQHYLDSRVELLKYGTSHDTCSDSNTCVGYGALSVIKE